MSQRRNFVRVDSELLFAVEPVAHLPAHWQRTAKMYLTDFDGAFKLKTDTPGEEDVLRMLVASLGEIRDELRRISEKLGIETSQLVRRPINISGSGFSFWQTSKYKKDTILQLSAVLPLDTPVLVKAVGTVVDDPLYDDAYKMFRHKVNFEVIHEDDRELIIRYTFKRQRELINLNREE